MAVSKKKARNLPKFFKNLSDFITFFLEMWQFFRKFSKKFTWPFCFRPKSFNKMANFSPSKNQFNCATKSAFHTDIFHSILINCSHHLYTLNNIFKVVTQYVAVCILILLNKMTDPNRKESVTWSHERPADFFLFSHRWTHLSWHSFLEWDNYIYQRRTHKFQLASVV